MALKATVYKVNLSIADMDRQYYGDHQLTLACHPSETEERMMVRLLAFSLYASDELVFTRGISTDDEPDLWQRDLAGQINLWVELGTPDIDRIRKGCHRADQMVVMCFGDRAPGVWWDRLRPKVSRFDNLTVLHLAGDDCQSLRALIARTMGLQVSIQDGQVLVTDGEHSAHVTPGLWLSASNCGASHD